jgi:hypothetical protein
MSIESEVSAAIDPKKKVNRRESVRITKLFSVPVLVLPGIRTSMTADDTRD